MSENRCFLYGTNKGSVLWHSLEESKVLPFHQQENLPLRRSVWTLMAEVHIIGQLSSTSGFPCASLFCKWSLQLGGGWKVVEGVSEGQTQADQSDTGNTSTWCHPIDLHLSTRGIQGWPRLLLQVYRQDDLGRVDLCGYGVTHVPTRPGHHTLVCHTWRPVGTFGEEVRRAFLGGGPQLLSTEFIHSSLERYRLHTIAAGQVHLELGIILRNFEKYGVIY